MRVVVTGGTGFIGRSLVALLLSKNYEVTVLTRRRPDDMPSGAKAAVWPAAAADGEPPWQEALEGAVAVIHLAGEPIASRRWSEDQKWRIMSSRVLGTRRLVDAIIQAKRRPEVLISGSAVGYYGWPGDMELQETAGPGRDFLSEVCIAWEKEALQAESAGLRVALLRTGIVLDKDGGALPKMLLPFRIFAGGPVSSGKQWMPWIHRDDIVELIVFLMENRHACGPVNAVSPAPVTNLTFSRTLAGVLHRPCWLPVPGPLLKLAAGEMAEPLLLNGQRAVPAKALELGFNFRYPNLEKALKAIYSTRAAPPTIH